jgi:hypothetical protein
VDDEFTAVRLEAVLATLRGEKGGQVIFGGVWGAAGATIALVLNVMVPVAIVPAIILPTATYFVSRRAHQRALQRATIALEQALDRLERGDRQRLFGHRLIFEERFATTPTRAPCMRKRPGSDESRRARSPSRKPRRMSPRSFSGLAPRGNR